MNTLPSISVLMCVHNGAKHIREAIDSILNQTYSDFEFIIVDDASSDETPKMLASYDDSRIRLIRNSENIGLTKSLNKGLGIALGNYIARMDADDISLPQRLEIQKEYLDTHNNIVCVGTGTIIVDNDGKKIGIKKSIANIELLKFYLLLKNQITHSSVMFRKSVIFEQGQYNENIRYAQDYELWSRLLLKQYHFSNINEPLLKYRFHAYSITQGATKDQAYKSAQETVFKNISSYINCSKEDFAIFIKSMHQHYVDSIMHAYIAQKILLDFQISYLKKEKVSQETAKQIEEYIRRERIGCFRWYASHRFGIMYKILVKIVKFFK